MVGVTVADSGDCWDAGLGELSDVGSSTFFTLALVGEEKDFSSSDDSGFVSTCSAEFFEVVLVVGGEVDSGWFAHALKLIKSKWT